MRIIIEVIARTPETCYTTARPTGREDTHDGNHEATGERCQGHQARTGHPTTLLHGPEARSVRREPRVCPHCGTHQGNTPYEVQYDLCGKCGRGYLSKPEYCEYHNYVVSGGEAACTRCGKVKEKKSLSREGQSREGGVLSPAGR